VNRLRKEVNVVGTCGT